jgi:diadenosine tetraphosphatase ApaH/serine/threonine PP2A family protein phosphatase
VRILIVSDIHANLDALEACLEAAPEYDQVFNLGDIVGYGANPNEVTEFSRTLGSVFVRGNHDKACSGVSNLDSFNPIAGLAAIWTQQELTPENLDFLRNLPQGPLFPREQLQLVHGSPRDEDQYLLLSMEADPLLAEASIPLTFFGHTHVQRCFLMEQGESKTKSLAPSYKSARGKQSVTLHLKATTKYLVNPGSIGQPRDSDPRAAFLLYDTDENSITFYRVPYDIGRAQEKILSAGLPQRLATRLAEGR